MTLDNLMMEKMTKSKNKKYNYSYSKKYIKTLSLEDIIEDFENFVYNKKFKFEEDDNTYGTFLAEDNENILIKNFSEDLPPIRLENFIKKWIKELELEEDLNFSNPNPKEINQNNFNKEKIKYYIERIDYKKNNPFFDRFKEHLQINLFSTIYDNHPNIKQFKHSKKNIWIPCLYFEDKQGNQNIRYKKESWRTLKGLKNIGGFINGYNNKKATTLLLCEGFKDGLNASIAFKNSDVLFIDSKTSKYNFDYVNLDNYRYIYLLQDRDVTNYKSMFSSILNKKDILKKIKLIDWDKVSDKKLKDISDIIESFISGKKITSYKKLREVSTKLLKALFYKKNGLSCLNDFIQLEENLKLSSAIKESIEKDNRFRFNQLLKNKLLNGGSINDIELKYYFQQFKPSKNATIFHLHKSKYISTIKHKIYKELDKYNKIVIGSPTGTGKSFFINSEIIKDFKKVLVISPLTEVLKEFTNFKRIENIEDFFNTDYKSLTTDKLFIMLHDKSIRERVLNELKDIELIIFDEQHLINESENFRGRVTYFKNFLTKDIITSKVITMSGTPIYSDFKNFHHIQIKLSNKLKQTIIYNKVVGEKTISFFENKEDILNFLEDETKESDILIYCSNTKRANEIYEFLDTQKRDINYYLLTSKRETYYKNNHSKKFIYISTTKATTGKNFDNLKTILQYGTTFNTNTFIQLVARIRGNGKFIRLTQGKIKAPKFYNIEDIAINILKFVKESKIFTFSTSIFDNLTDKEKDLIAKYFNINPNIGYKAFLTKYKKALDLISSISLVKKDFMVSEEYDLYFNKEAILRLTYEAIEKEIFKYSDYKNSDKFLDNLIINSLDNNMELDKLNKYYNLSFTIKNHSLVDREIILQAPNNKDVNLISKKQKEEKKKQREEREKLKKQYIEPKCKRYESLNLNDFLSSKDIEKLLDKNKIDLIEFNSFIDRVEKEISFKEYLQKLKDLNEYKKTLIIKFFAINEKYLIKFIQNEIFESGFISLKDISKFITQNIKLTISRNKYPYSQLIRDILTDVELMKIFNYARYGLKFNKLKKINNKQYKSVITIDKTKPFIDVRDFEIDIYKEFKEYAKNKLDIDTNKIIDMSDKEPINNIEDLFEFFVTEDIKEQLTKEEMKLTPEEVLELDILELDEDIENMQYNKLFNFTVTSHGYQAELDFF